jgi:hypothetical protein
MYEFGLVSDGVLSIPNFVIIIQMKSAVFWDIMPCSPQKSNISEYHLTSIFKAEEYAKQEISIN